MYCYYSIEDLGALWSENRYEYNIKRNNAFSLSATGSLALIILKALALVIDHDISISMLFSVENECCCIFMSMLKLDLCVVALCTVHTGVVLRK